MIDINDEYFDEESMNIEGFDIIGHGNDTIEEWEDNPVGKAVEALDNLLNKGDGAGYYAADWKVIYNKVPELKRLAQGQHYYESIEDLLQDIPKINSESHCWGGDSPGRSGCYYIFRVPSGEQTGLTDLLLRLTKATQVFLDESAEYSRLIAGFEIELEEHHRRENKLQREKQEHAILQAQAEAYEQTRKHDDKIAQGVRFLRDYLDDPREPFCCWGMLLATKDRWIYWITKIWAYNYLEETDVCCAIIELLNGQYAGVVKVREEVRQGVEMCYIPYFGGAARPLHVGWRHDKTDLQVVGSTYHRDPVKVREEFLHYYRQRQNTDR